ncbi:hypothetical protein OHA10_36880 [Kribbella sp. NBC_00662]|uniref:hypothetical protein n=1 Tax=Kribbella sp. NBC_00662 TaxID=2975969 RepID=UPI003254F4FE
MPLEDTEPISLITPTTAAELLPHMLTRFRLGYQDPLIFGTTKPEAVLIPYTLWHTLSPVDNSGPDQR